MDKTKYIFNGNSFGKGRLVLAVVEKYVSDNPNTSRQQLDNKFPSKLQGSIGVVTSIEEAEGKFEGKRHFVKSPIKLTDATVAVCSQWGVNNINDFLEHVSLELGFSIDEKLDAGEEEVDQNEADALGLDTVIHEVKYELDRIILANEDQVTASESMKVRPGYGPDKFYLDKVDGSYDSSLQSLIHFILWEKNLYHSFLTARQLADAKAVVEDDPDSIYRPDLDDESTSDEEYQQDQELDEMLDSLYWQVITHVGKALSKFSFFDKSDFEDNGFVDETD